VLGEWTVAFETEPGATYEMSRKQDS